MPHLLTLGHICFCILLSKMDVSQNVQPWLRTEQWFIRHYQLVQRQLYFVSPRARPSRQRACLEKVGNLGTLFQGNVTIWREIVVFGVKKYIRNIGKVYIPGVKFCNHGGKCWLCSWESSHIFQPCSAYSGGRRADVLFSHKFKK